MDIDGFDGLAAEMESLKNDIDVIRASLPEAMDNAVEESAEELEEEMKRQVKAKGLVDTGKLLNSITHDQMSNAKAGAPAVQSVGPERKMAPYARHVEFGTGEHGPSGESYKITPEGVSENDIRRMSMESRAKGDLTQEIKDASALSFDGNAYIWVDHPGSRARPFFRDSIKVHQADRRLVKALEKHTTNLFRAVRT